MISKQPRRDRRGCLLREKAGTLCPYEGVQYGATRKSMKKRSSTSTKDIARVLPEKIAARFSIPLFLFARLNLNMGRVYHIFSPEDSKSPPRFSQERASFRAVMA